MPEPADKHLGIVFWICILWVVLVALAAITADWWPVPPPDRMDWNNPAAPAGTPVGSGMSRETGDTGRPGHTHWLGTDTMGRDLVSRLIHGARISLSVGLLAPLTGLLIGGLLGCLAGYYRGVAGSAIVAAMDIILAFPGLVLLLAVSFYLGAGLPYLILALGFLSVPAFCRVARAKTLALSNLEFIQAARLTGAGNLAILSREIIPNVVIPVAVYGLLVAAFMIMAEGALSFLGLGVPPPAPSWGGMIAEGREVLDETPHVSMIPALVMFLTVLAFNLIGDRLRVYFERGERQL